MENTGLNEGDYKVALPDKINIDCPYQYQNAGTMICKIALKPDAFTTTTTEVTPQACYECLVGRIYRELGCDKISGKIRIYMTLGKDEFEIENLWCSLRKRNTDYEYCLTCPYIGTRFSAPILEKTLDYFKKLGFSAAKENLEKARERLLNGDSETAITNSISAVESTFKAILDKLKEPYPKKEQITTLWKSIKDKLHLGDEVSAPHLVNLLGSISGCVSAMGGLRNEISDAHGKGLISASVYDSYAELSLNLSASICLFIIRRYQELKLEKKGDLT